MIKVYLRGLGHAKQEHARQCPEYGPGSQCLSLLACMPWCKEMHKQEFAVWKEKQFNTELARLETGS